MRRIWGRYGWMIRSLLVGLGSSQAIIFIANVPHDRQLAASALLSCAFAFVWTAVVETPHT